MKPFLVNLGSFLLLAGLILSALGCALSPLILTYFR